MEHSILEWSIRALLLIVGTSLVVAMLRVRDASMLHRVWTAAMMAMLLLPVWTQWGLSITAPVLPAEYERVTPPRISSGFEVPFTEASPTAASEPSPSVPRPKRLEWRWMPLALYLAGVAAMLARLIWGTLRLQSMTRHARKADGFLASSSCAAPVTIGWLRPALILPNDWPTWPTATLDAVLIHEREHARRRDPLVQWLALLNRCVFWFHPLAWWLERKLAALAEEACDAAVLAAGHTPHDYARYLIEMARSVNETGARMQWAGAVEFSAGNLPRRIRRIMDAPPAVAISRAKAIASASLCVLVLATFLGCNLGRRASSSPGQAAKNEQAVQRLMGRQFSDAEVSKAALSLTPDAAKELETYVKAHPDHSDQVLELVLHYQSKKDLRSLNELTLWLIGQHPGMRLNWASRPAWDTVWDKDGYERAKMLWTEQLKKSWDSPFVYMNAAEFLSGNDNEQAEQILLVGQRRFPSSDQRWSGLHWEVFLARHYAWALTGSAGQLPEREMADLCAYSGAPPADGPYAQRVRATLLASNDTELLTRTVEQLQCNRPNVEFSHSLIERVLAIDPNNRQARMQRREFQRFALETRAKADPSSLNDAERMMLLESQFFRRPVLRAEVKDSEATARELLALASHNTNDPDYGTAVFLANLALGEAALNRGDKAGAVRCLLAASDAPPTEFLRDNRIDISLARSLVDAGERESVAAFLDRCAKFNRDSRRLAEWAVQIREGLNPKLV